jgi:hypothetical protein
MLGCNSRSNVLVTTCYTGAGFQGIAIDPRALSRYSYEVDPRGKEGHRVPAVGRPELCYEVQNTAHFIMHCILRTEAVHNMYYALLTAHRSSTHHVLCITYCAQKQYTTCIMHYILRTEAVHNMYNALYTAHRSSTQRVLCTVYCAQKQCTTCCWQ